MAVTPRQRARRVRLLALDVDGVLTDGAMYYGAQGEALKRFHTRDGKGIELVRRSGVQVAIITSETSEIVTLRAAKLQIELVFQGVTDKLALLNEQLTARNISFEDVAFVGDDLGDLEVMKNVGLAVAVADAIEAIRKAAHLVTSLPGGNGAVREVCDLIAVR